MSAIDDGVVQGLGVSQGAFVDRTSGQLDLRLHTGSGDMDR